MIKKIIISDIVVLMLTLTGIMVQAQEPSVLIQKIEVSKKTICKTLTVYGRVQPAFDSVVSISLPHAGLITHVEVRIGQRIRRGDILIEMATSPGEYLQYIQARNAEQYAKRKLIREKRMLQEQLTTKAQIDSACKSLSDARSRLKALEKQGKNRAIRTLTSPINGIIIKLKVKQGDRVQADTVALTIANENHLIAQLGIEPEDIHLIKPGTPVIIKSIFIPNYQVKSRLLEIHAMINPSTHLVNALVPIPKDKTDHLVLGNYLKADLQLKVHTGITIPRNAVLQDDQGHYVFIVINGKARRINVKIGLEDYKWIEITKGLKPFQWVVSSGNYELKDGMAVREKQ